MPKKNLTQAEMKEFAAEMSKVDWSKAEDRMEIALTILFYVKEDVERQDMEDLLVEVHTFNIGETPNWNSQHGLKAHVHVPGSYAPRSTITQTTLTIDTEQVSVHPEFELNQLRAGRYGDMSEIQEMAVDELLGRKNAIIWSTIINSISASDDNYGTFASGASSAAKLAELNTALSYVEDETRRKALSIVGRTKDLNWLMDTSLWTEPTAEQIEKQGILGNYRGVPIVRLSQYTDGYGNRWIQEGEILVVGSGSTKLGRNQDLEVLEGINIDDKMWHLRIDEQYGVVVHYPRKNYRIHIS